MLAARIWFIYIALSGYRMLVPVIVTLAIFKLVSKVEYLQATIDYLVKMVDWSG